MKFLLDHDVPDVAGRVLASAGQQIALLRQIAPTDSPDAAVLELAGARTHPGIIVLIRRRTRAIENAKLLALLDTAGDSGITGNINFA